jgi:1-deoxy-D-xylulose-5-phosphate reductoisomerase
MNAIPPRPIPVGKTRSVSILGSTGSIGCNTVDLIARNVHGFSVEAITGNRNAGLLAQQARLLKAKLAVVADESAYGDLKAALSGSGVAVAAGREALLEAAERPADWVMASIVGAAGLQPTLAAVRRGTIVALANKECLVCAGGLMMNEVRQHGSRIIPVDSEHSAIFQVFDFENFDTVESIILTASGGPFRSYDRSLLASVTPAQAVAHPNWSMGAKISVDSATMMNKGLELIEAFHLFPVRETQIEIVVHPQSIIHSMVAYVDGSVLAQLGCPDMRTPIACALAWPGRMAAPSARLRLDEIGRLDFEPPDEDRFPALRLARVALQSGGAATAILNAANEEAVYSFLNAEIGFLEITEVVERTLEAMGPGSIASIEDVVETDREARRHAKALIARVNGRPVYAAG